MNFFRYYLVSLLLAGSINIIAMQAYAASPGLPYEDIPKPDFSTPVTLEEVREAFYRYSAPAIVEKLMENKGANWDVIMNKVAGGDGDWIHHTIYFISPGTDAGTSDDVRMALANALPKNPKAVLCAEINGKYPSLEVCSLPFIESEYYFVKDYGEGTLAALHLVDAPELLEVRDNCARVLRELLEAGEKDHKEGRW